MISDRRRGPFMEMTAKERESVFPHLLDRLITVAHLYRIPLCAMTLEGKVREFKALYFPSFRADLR